MVAKRCLLVGLMGMIFGACTELPSELDPDNAEPIAPRADFSFAKIGEDELMYQFNASASTDEDGTIVSYMWDFADGSAMETSPDPTIMHTFRLMDTTLTVSLVVTDNTGLTGTIQKEVMVTRNTVPPMAAFLIHINGVEVDTAFSDMLVSFDASGSNDPDGTIQTYRWDFGDGSEPRTSTVPAIGHIYSVPEPMTFDVQLTVTDNETETGQASKPIVIVPAPHPTASFVAPDTVVSGTEAEFDAGTSTVENGTIESYVWDFGDGTDAAETTSPVITHTYIITEETIFDVRLQIIATAGASDDTLKQIVVVPPDEAPEAMNDFYGARTADSLMVQPAIGLLANDEDEEPDDLAIELVRGALNGTARINPDGSFVYQSDVAFTGLDSLGYRITDASGQFDEATVFINVQDHPTVRINTDSLLSSPDTTFTVSYQGSVQDTLFALFTIERLDGGDNAYENDMLRFDCSIGEDDIDLLVGLEPSGNGVPCLDGQPGDPRIRIILHEGGRADLVFRPNDISTDEEVTIRMTVTDGPVGARVTGAMVEFGIALDVPEMQNR